MASSISRRDDTGWKQYDKDCNDTLSFFSPGLLHVSECGTASGSTLNEQSRRPWEDLDKDCLANIFSRVPMLDLLMQISFVCKAWHQASLNPQCWRHLDIRSKRDYPLSGLLKLAASRSQGGATVLLMPIDSFDECLEVEDLDFIAGAFKGLRVVNFRWIIKETTQKHLAEVINSWTDLEGLCPGVEHGYLAETVAAVARSCPRFHQLQLADTTLMPEVAAAVAQNLGPRLTYLGLARLSVLRDDLLLLLRACKALRYLNIKDCRGFPTHDPDIMKFGAGVQKFVYKPYYGYDSDEESAYNISTRDVYDGNSDDGYEL